MTAGEALLLPHISYLKPLEGLLDKGLIKGLAHITGGGLTDNIPRILPEGTAVRIERGSWPIPPLFELLRKLGNVSDAEMYRTFNMGVGNGDRLCREADVEAIQTHLGECYQNRECRERQSRGTHLKKRIAILISGRGSNMLALSDAVRDGRIPDAEIAVVISDKAERAWVGAGAGTWD